MQSAPDPTTRAILSFASVSGILGYLLIAGGVFLAPHLASRAGLSLAAIGSTWASVRILTIVIDPVLGLMMDRTRTPFGRYRVWLLAGAAVLMAAIHALFQPPTEIGTTYLFVWLLLFYVGISAVTIAHSAWAATLATDPNQRSRIFGLLGTVFVIGGVVVLVFPLLGGAWGWTSSASMGLMGWFVIVVTPITLILALGAVREPKRLAQSQPVGLRDVLLLLRQPDLARLLLAQITLTLGPGWMSDLYIFFLTRARGFTIGEASGLLLAYMISGVGGALLIARLALRIGKHRALMVAAVAFSAGLGMIVFVPKASLLATLPIMAWCGFMSVGFDMMIRAMSGDLSEYVRATYGTDQTGLIYALNSAANKLALAVAIGLTFPILAAIGFDARDGVANSANALRGLEIAFVAGPAVFVALGAVSVLGWRSSSDSRTNTGG